MTVRPEGYINVVIGTLSRGQGHETSFAQLVTEWLGVPLDSVRLITGDTDFPGNWGGYRSRIFAQGYIQAMLEAVTGGRAG